MDLPSPRDFLTSLLNTISKIPNPASTTVNHTEAPSNALKLLPSTHRALFSTLHVLIPPPTLLYALDLLDRGLVTRLIQSSSSSSEASEGQSPEQVRIVPPQADIHLSPLSPSPSSSTSEGVENATETTAKKERNDILYQVRSSQQPKSRFSAASTTAAIGTTVYTVHLQAWNCSCAAFTFSAFPGGFDYDPSFMEEDIDDLNHDYESTERYGEEEGEWEYGGLSFDGTRKGEGEGNVPICKHLLACLLAERWGDVLGGYVKERVVGREEMAGFGGES